MNNTILHILTFHISIIQKRRIGMEIGKVIELLQYFMKRMFFGDPRLHPFRYSYQFISSHYSPLENSINAELTSFHSPLKTGV